MVPAGLFGIKSKIALRERYQSVNNLGDTKFITSYDTKVLSGCIEKWNTQKDIMKKQRIN
jgi:hypothetical protein